MATATATNKAAAYREIEEAFGLVPQWVKQLPDSAVTGFWAVMRDFYFGETVIPNKYKELIGVAVSGATRCRYCALFHTEGARLHGATDEEIAEANTMGGVTMMASTFINGQQIDYQEFRRETVEIVKYVKQQQAKAPPSKSHQAHA
jgi:AhpD family alkylhydroperoxidase